MSLSQPQRLSWNGAFQLLEVFCFMQCVWADVCVYMCVYVWADVCVCVCVCVCVYVFAQGSGAEKVI